MAHPIFVIPDIHGQAAKLDSALHLIESYAGEAAPIVFLGDLVDRGPDSRGVIDRLLRGIEQGRSWTVLRGNHDQLFLDFLTASKHDWPALCDRYLSGNMGGEATLASYGLPGNCRDLSLGDLQAAIPEAHRAFLDALPHSLETEHLFLCHAGIRPGIPFETQSPDDLVWIREPFLSDTRDHGKLVVHGHTPVDRPEHHGNRVALDAGAGWGRDLHVAVFEGREAWLLTETGRVALGPR